MSGTYETYRSLAIISANVVRAAYAVALVVLKGSFADHRLWVESRLSVRFISAFMTISEKFPSKYASFIRYLPSFRPRLFLPYIRPSFIQLALAALNFSSLLRPNVAQLVKTVNIKLRPMDRRKPASQFAKL